MSGFFLSLANGARTDVFLILIWQSSLLLLCCSMESQNSNVWLSECALLLYIAFSLTSIGDLCHCQQLTEPFVWIYIFLEHTCTETYSALAVFLQQKDNAWTLGSFLPIAETTPLQLLFESRFPDIVIKQQATLYYT